MLRESFHALAESFMVIFDYRESKQEINAGDYAIWLKKEWEIGEVSIHLLLDFDMYIISAVIFLPLCIKILLFF